MTVTGASRTGMGTSAPPMIEPSVVPRDHRVEFDSMRFTSVITHESPWYVARCLEVEVTSQGETVESALANLREALELYFEDAPVPELGEPPIIASVEVAA